MWRYIIGGLALLGSTALDIWLPLITMSIVDDVIVGGNMEMLKWDLIMIMVVCLARAIAQYVKEFLCDMAGCYVSETMRKDLMWHIQRLSRSFFVKNNTGELMAHVKDDTGKIWDICGFAGMLLVEAAVYFVGVIILMFRLNWQLALVPVAFLPILGVLVFRLERVLDKKYDDLSEENAALTRTIEEDITGIRCVKAFAAEDHEIKKFSEHNAKYAGMNKDLDDYIAKREPIIGFIPKVMQILLLLLAGYLAMNGKITYGLMVAFLQYASNIVWPIENMGWLTQVLSYSIASYRKVKKIFDAQPEITEKEDAVALEKLTSPLVFEHVSFGLDDTRILEDISFRLDSGKTLGIMGATGAGKSTVVNLIQRFYDVTDGAIRIGDTDIRDMKLDDVRAFSSVVNQEIFLFSDTIKENVKLGHKESMSDKKVKQAVRTAHAAEFVEKLTGGYDTVIGERGIGLSGGQKQRLSIARALAKKAGVLILDDSTSALDMETETDIQRELKDKKDMSKIIIAHRISSVKDADEILVLDHGRISERGNHEELIAQKGFYYSTYEAQFGNYREALGVLNEESEGLACQ